MDALENEGHPVASEQPKYREYAEMGMPMEMRNAPGGPKNS